MKTKKLNITKEPLKLKKCLIAANPEMVRNYYEDEPCDDSRA